jgi:hypothetical protein
MSWSKIFVRKESSKQTKKITSFIPQVENGNTEPLSYTKPPLLALITGTLHLLLRNVCGKKGIHNRVWPKKAITVFEASHSMCNAVST